MAAKIKDTFRRPSEVIETDYTGPDYAGVTDAIWIAMFTNLARMTCGPMQTLALEDELQIIVEDLSPGGFIASGNRAPVREAVAKVLGEAWVRVNDWGLLIPGQRSE